MRKRGSGFKFWKGLCFLLGGGIATSNAAEWTTHARRFTGESERVRSEGIVALKKDPELAERLKKALGTENHFLALDVIAALKMRSLLPALLDFSEKDKTGYSYHVINSLIRENDFPKIVKVYRSRLESPRTSSASRMSLLDALGRMQVELSPDELRTQFQTTEPEVRSAVLSYARMALLKWRKTPYLELVEAGMRDRAFQVRIQSYFLISELQSLSAKAPTAESASAKEKWTKIWTNCSSDPIDEVRRVCRSLERGT